MYDRKRAIVATAAEKLKTYLKKNFCYTVHLMLWSMCNCCCLYLNLIDVKLWNYTVSYICKFVSLGCFAYLIFFSAFTLLSKHNWLKFSHYCLANVITMYTVEERVKYYSKYSWNLYPPNYTLKVYLDNLTKVWCMWNFLAFFYFPLHLQHKGGYVPVVAFCLCERISYYTFCIKYYYDGNIIVFILMTYMT